MINDDLFEKLTNQDRDVAVREVAALVRSSAFSEWLDNPQGGFPLAVLADADVMAIGAKTRIAQLSVETAAKQRRHHPELTTDEYAQAQPCIDHGERVQDGQFSCVYLLEEAGHITVVKATKTGLAVFVTSFRRLSGDAAKRDSEVRRLRNKGRRV